MKLLIFLSQLLCKHKNVYNKSEYRVYDSIFRNSPVKRYEHLMITRCKKCDKILEINVLEKDLTKSKLRLLKGLSNEEINSIREAIK